MKTIEQFCSAHRACPEGREWALANCKDMQEVWSTAKPTWVIWVATRPRVLTDRELRLFAVHCARSVQHLLTDPRSFEAITVAERYANGEATEGELAAARAAAWDAAREAAWAADCDTAWAATRAAARDAACDTAWAAALAAAEAVQAEWLRNNTQPNFS